MMFRYDPENATIARCKVRAQAWTDPLLQSRWLLLDKNVSALMAEKVFDLARADSEGDPEKIRAGEVPPLWQRLW